MSYGTLINLETLLIAVVGTWLALVALQRLLTRTRPNLAIARPINVGFVLRLGTIAGVSASGLGQQLRGGDEATYLAQAHHMVASPWFSAPWTPEFSQRGSDNLHVILFAIQMKALHFGTDALRITQVGLALAGAILIVAAVYDLAGPRAARLTAWFAALEPTGVLFSGTLLKEPLLDFAIGLVIFGAARTWRRLDLSGLLVMASGCVVAVFARGYVGFFLIAASLLVLLHVSARNLRRRTQAIPVLLGVVVVLTLLSPTIVRLTSPTTLQSALQSAQNANTLVTPGPGIQGAVGTPNSNNLALEPVNFSSRIEIIKNLPVRIRDLLLKPYPWQLGDWSQRFGAIGGLAAIALLLILLRYAWGCRGEVFRRAGPLLYPALMMLIAFSLSVGNAGTGFRYRAHLLIPAIGILSVLWIARRERAPTHERRRVFTAYSDDRSRRLGVLGSAGSVGQR